MAIDQEVHNLIDTCHKEVAALLDTNRDTLSRIAEALLEREVLSGDDVDDLIAGRPLKALENGNTYSPTDPAAETEPETEPDPKPTEETEPEIPTDDQIDPRLC